MEIGTEQRAVTTRADEGKTRPTMKCMQNIKAVPMVRTMAITMGVYRTSGLLASPFPIERKGIVVELFTPPTNGPKI
jgi:hypothetical protein